ncbi:MAG: NADH-quinone oxidoreductase subunit A [Vicinamibacterales bacterium]
MSEYVGIIIFFVMTGAVVGTFIVLASILGPSKPSKIKSEPFECGEVPFALPMGHVSVKFYLTAILFVLFDVEVVFLYPWAVAYSGLGLTGLVQMVIFIVILMAGFFYAWDNGALEWS